MSVTVTGTWAAGVGNDPAPPSVIVIETVKLDQSGLNGDGTLATGKLDDGFGDKSVVVQTPSGPDEICTTPSGTPLAYQTVKKGSSFTLTHTFTVSSTAAGGGNGCAASAHFDSYTAKIHAQPYNFRSSGYTDVNGVHQNKSVQDNPNATLMLSYIWDSTDGVKADLGSSTINKNVTWDSNSPGVGSFGMTPDGQKVYAPPSPPVGTDAQGKTLAYLVSELILIRQLWEDQQRLLEPQILSAQTFPM